MNNGKVCISICAATVNELFQRLKKAASIANVVEVRFDCISATEMDTALSRFSLSTLTVPVIATFRPKEQGGRRAISIDERKAFWQRNGSLFWGSDREEDLLAFPEGSEHRIVSHHDFSEIPAALTEIFSRLIKGGPDMVKIAAHVDQAQDAIPLWKLLAPQSNEFGVVPIAMGEAGKWTRILGLAHGAAMTYASLETGSETAPGQVSAEDLVNVFRVKQLDRTTAVYGIIAADTSHSMSPYMQNAAFKQAEQNKVFVPFQVDDLGAFMNRMVQAASREIDLNFGGFAVTNPHKQAMIQHLDHIDETARAIGAVNTVNVRDGELHGYNTDAVGFIGPLKRKYGDLTDADVAIIGAGGAARACVFALEREKAKVTVYAREPNRAAELASTFGVESAEFLSMDSEQPTSFGRFDILVNATPLGTTGRNENQTVATSEQLRGVKLVYDLIYNPKHTRLIREAKTIGAETIGGLEMLAEQGARQFEIWTGHPAPMGSMSAAVDARINIK